MVADEEDGDGAMTDVSEAGDALCSLARYGLVHGCLRCGDELWLFAQTMDLVGV